MRRTPTMIIVLALAATGCGRFGTDTDASAPSVMETRLIVYTVNYPLAYFAERIGGDLAEVRFPAPSEADPASWSPDDDTVAAYQGADLILLNGAGYARWVGRAGLPESKTVNTSSTFADRYIEIKAAVADSRRPDGADELSGWVSTTWLDPTLAIEQAENISRAFIAVRRDAEPIFNERFTALEADLRLLDQRLATAAEALGDTPLLFSQPTYQYLIRRYGLNAVEVQWEPCEPPDGSAWTELEAILMRHPAQWMLWNGEPLDDTVAGLHDLGVGSLLFDPCANAPEFGDYLSVMDANAGSMETIAETTAN